MTSKLNKYDAPDWDEAVAVHGAACAGCKYVADCDGCTARPCIANRRSDGINVIFRTNTTKRYRIAQARWKIDRALAEIEKQLERIQK